MKIFPAIDIKDGRAVRLTRGEFDSVRSYSDDPVAVAQSFFDAGAKYLHVVDLDGAREGSPRKLDTIRRIAELPLFIEVGGGIRDRGRICQMLDVGVSRVILGTAALRDEEFLRASVSEFGGAVALGVDARDGKVAVGGWLETTTVDAFDFIRRAGDMGVKTVIFTDIATDGAMSGTNIPAFRKLTAMGGPDIIASGGICSMDELRELATLGCAGAIIGKALYEGALSLEEVLKL